ncbi:MAG: heparinase II/III-family protein [Gemmatimonadota bacterium]|nr:heparinase II/III-family protein [Gemmatimonadota bacterium]
MSILVSAEDLLARRRVATGALAPLAAGLRAELEPLVARPPEVPTMKARLSRAGEADERFRLYWHQLWLAERVLHAALIGVLLDNRHARALAASLLDAYADQYLRYPNRDNVLGPSRPFFSTYLESIWLLQLVLALDLLEAGAPAGETGELGGRVRDRLVVPSAVLIASYDECMSNRQVWNNAALAAAGILLGDDTLVKGALLGRSGLHEHLERALLRDGSWYEGENYHLFAHRGLWYCVQIAERHGYALPPQLEGRFREGFAAPFRTLLPDLTYPSRKDSQYAVSIRQPRFAESCELGIARHDDERLVGILARLYAADIPRGDTGRARSSADVERNLPATGLTRADLSWRSLLFAREHLPRLVPSALESDLLPAQGIGVLRRDRATLYVALDYGHGGGGHGHPDRLNLLLADGDVRWFDDPGTGSYVDPSLHWYRSTLAHTAPLVDGRSQPAVDGQLIGFYDCGEAAWISATAPLATGLRVRRSVVLMKDYLVDVLEWDTEGDAVHEVALPWHGVDLVNELDEPLARTPHPITGGETREDGFGFLSDTALVHAPDGVQRVRGHFAGHELRGWVLGSPESTWWSARAPDAPTRSGLIRLLLVRRSAQSGRYLSVWSWRDAITSVDADVSSVRVELRDGASDRHSWDLAGWCIERERVQGNQKRRDRVVLGGIRGPAEDTPISESPAPQEISLDSHALPATFVLGEPNYRRSEESWSEAGRPTATVMVATTRRDTLVINVDVSHVHRCFVAVDAENPLDNEPAAINGAGVQLYVVAGERKGGWLLVPDPSSRNVTVHEIEGWEKGLRVSAGWEPTESGYALVAEVALPTGTTEASLDVIVNETAPGRERRRGQLVLSGARGEFVYLRGDRHDAARLLRFSLS